MWEGISTGFSTVFMPVNLLLVACGCIAGTFIGMLPGLGPISAIALMIPITYGFDPASGMILMAGVYYGAIFGGSTSSILVNAPGVAGTVATSFDGYPMAMQGKAGKALAIAAVASFAGGTIGALLLMLAAHHAMAGANDLAIARLAEAVDSGMIISSKISKEFPYFRELDGNPEYEAIQVRMIKHLNAERQKLGLPPVQA